VVHVPFNVHGRKLRTDWFLYSVFVVLFGQRAFFVGRDANVELSDASKHCKAYHSVRKYQSVSILVVEHAQFEMIVV
jgi:hypothetical protein